MDLHSNREGKGYDRPAMFMTVRRIALTVLGFSGGALAALMLCVSAQSILTQPVHSTSITPVQRIEFPYAIPGTTLIVEALSAYDGPFLEDGTDREVVDAATLIVKNAGAKPLESVRISLYWNDGVYTFTGSYIPAGGTIALLEQNAKGLESVIFSHCTGEQREVQSQLIDQEITVTEEEMGTIILTNTTDRHIFGITIYYKTWLSPQGMYIGGITYAMDVSHLLPGQTIYVYPDHYAVGYSKVVCIQYDLQ